MGVRGFAAAWGGCGGCRTTAHLLLPSARSRPSEGPGAAGRGGEEEESGLPPSWFCIRALLGLSVHLRDWKLLPGPPPPLSLSWWVGL